MKNPFNIDLELEEMLEISQHLDDEYVIIDRFAINGNRVVITAKNSYNNKVIHRIVPAKYFNRFNIGDIIAL